MPLSVVINYALFKQRGACFDLFDPNNTFMYCLVAVVIVFVIAMSVRFIVLAWRRAKKLGISTQVLRRTAISAAVFTIVPAISILLGVIALSKALGFPLPWLRLSVIGALTYETPAAASAAQAVGMDLSQLITDPKVFAAIAWVMTLGIVPGTILVPAFGKKIENGIMRIRSKDEKWGSIFMSALFLGMISAFLGMVFGTIRDGLQGWIPFFVMVVSALLMCVCAVFVKVLKWSWMEHVRPAAEHAGRHVPLHPHHEPCGFSRLRRLMIWTATMLSEITNTAWAAGGCSPALPCCWLCPRPSA